MNAVRQVVAAALVLGATGVAGTAQRDSPPQATQTFRSRSTMVSVDVSVRSGNKPVPGLAPTDFLLTDNGVPQTIELVDVDAVPVDISLVVDVSGSTAAQLNQYKADVKGIATTIRPQDRLRVITFGTDPKQIMALQPAGVIPDVDDMDAGSSSSVYDGIAAALIRSVDLDRRHLIVAFTDGRENSSILTLEMLMGIAKQSESVLHVSGSSSRPLNEVAEATGGANHMPPMPLGRGRGMHVAGSMLNDFRKIVEVFRQSYVLRYRPTGVKPDGWHDVKVTLVRRGRFDIRARRGYFGG